MVMTIHISDGEHSARKVNGKVRFYVEEGPLVYQEPPVHKENRSPMSQNRNQPRKCVIHSKKPNTSITVYTLW